MLLVIEVEVVGFGSRFARTDTTRKKGKVHFRDGSSTKLHAGQLWIQF